MTGAADHWLYRLDAESWLRAAAAEISSGEARVDARRAAVTHARRAAGMALNGVLVALGEATGDREAAAQRWGRSYIDHLRSLRSDPSLATTRLPAEAATTAAALLEISPVGGGARLVQLTTSAHRPAAQALDLARALCQACEASVRALSSSEAALPRLEH
jgi:hypothetical protein